MAEEVDLAPKPTSKPTCRYCFGEIQWRRVYGKPKQYNLDWSEHVCDRTEHKRRAKRSHRSVQELEQGFQRAINS